MKHGLGLKGLDSQGSRDRAGIRTFRRENAAPAHVLPAKFDYRAMFEGPPDDQFQVGSCVFWSGLGLYEAVIAKHFGVRMPVTSRRALYTQTQRATYPADQFGQDNGSYAVDMLATLKSVGWTPRSAWAELQAVTPDYFAQPPAGATSKVHDIIDYRYVGGFNNEDQATYIDVNKAAILHLGPALIGGDWATEWEEPGSSGDLLGANLTVAGGHERRRIGWDDTHVCLDGSRGAFLDLNQWGAGWGAEGINLMFTPYAMETRFVAHDVYAMFVPHP